MDFVLSEKVLKYLEEANSEAVELLEELCKIPAPSNHEEKRAEYCRNWLEKNGAEGVMIDDALNVIFPFKCDGKDDIVVFMAHTDTVFPDMTEPMPYYSDGKNIYSPGVGDDTICVVMMLMVIKYILKNNLSPRCGILFSANAGEEGLGNLKGIKQIMSDYENRIKSVYTFDGQYDEVICKCVGSHRYKISVETEGGHSFMDFGNLNAISVVAELIHNLNQCTVPTEKNSKTTYNIGFIEGGTSVNTIAQNASFLYEYLSDYYACIEKMKEFFDSKVKESQNAYDAKISVEILGIRPCGNEVDEALLEKMTQRVIAVCEKYSGHPCRRDSGSTDANIPMSLGIPAVCVGTYLGGGVHTKEEYLKISSIPIGMRIVAELILEYFI